MAREKGMGNLQHETSGRWTIRVSIGGKRYARSARTTDRAQAERFLQRFLSPFGLGTRHLPLAEVWNRYVQSPDRRDIAPSTLESKRLTWRHFADWMENNYLAVDSLGGITHEMVAEYLAFLRVGHCASTYNNRVCALREIFRTLGERAGLEDDPWEGVRLRNDDSHSRRELTVDELRRLLTAADGEYRLLFLIGIHTGLRLSDCCQLAWESVNLERGIIQVIPQKTRAHAHGRPVTIPIHAELAAALRAAEGDGTGAVMPAVADAYRHHRWRVSSALKAIFRAAGIRTSVKIEGRRRLTPEATFHSLRHTFVSLAANAGVPLTLVQAIVGHESTAMTRHYYHESEGALRSAIASIPKILQ